MDKDTIADAKERFKLAHDAESENRANALEDLKFARLGEQWPERDRKARESEGRPCLTINRLPAFARQIVNDARQNKPSIKTRPADGDADVKTADIYNGLIRNIEQSSNADVAYDTALESAVYGGFGYFRIKTDYACDDTFDLDLMIERVANPFTVYGDPNSQAADASDWRYGFVTEMVPKADFEAKYGKNTTTISWSADGDDRDGLWREDDSVRVAEYWERDEVMRPIVQLSSGLVLDASAYTKNRDIFDAQGITVIGERETRSYKVTQRILTGAEEISKTEWAGKYIPIVPVYGDEINIEGKRYFHGIVRQARDPQILFNYWRTCGAELVALAPKAPYIGPEGAFDKDMGKWQTAHVKSHPFLEYSGGVAPMRQPFAGVPAGALQEALNASDDMKSILGIYDASLGARSNETSGRAIMARQREGDVSTFHYIDNLARAIRYAGRVLIDLIPSVYDKPRIVRVLGEDGSPKTVPVNQPDEHGNVFALGRGKYDLVVETGPGYTTKRAEAAEFITEIIRANPQTAPLLMDVLARNMDMPEADKVAKRFQAMLPPPIQQMEAAEDGDEPDPGVLMGQLAQAQTQIQQMGQALQQAGQEVEAQRAKAEADLQAERERMRQEAETAIRKAELDAEARLRAARIDAQTDIERERIQSETEIRKARIGAIAARNQAVTAQLKRPAKEQP